jgi:dihydrolipoamide dehydrogenase
MAATASDLGMTIHTHPTLAESTMEAADAYFGLSTNIYTPVRGNSG